MKLEIMGLVIKEKDLNESDKVVTLLTSEKGIISAIAKRSKNFRNSLGGMIQLFSYGKFCIYDGKYGYLVNNFEIKELFSDLRYDLKALSLAQYFCQLCLALRPEQEVSAEVLRLFLNCLFYLSKKKKEILLIKGIFELKITSLCGYMPELNSCGKCGKQGNFCSFKIESGTVMCEKCSLGSSSGISISTGILTAMKHIIYSPFENLFKFSVSDKTIFMLNFITEKHVKYHVCERFSSLDFFNHLLELCD